MNKRLSPTPARLGATSVLAMTVLAWMFSAASFAQPLSMKTRKPILPSFSYKKSTSFDVKEVSAKTENGVTVRDVNYAAHTSERGRVKAYIVSPTGKGRFARRPLLSLARRAER